MDSPKTLEEVPGTSQDGSIDGATLPMTTPGGKTSDPTANTGTGSGSEVQTYMGMTPAELQAMSVAEKLKFFKNMELFAIMGLRDEEEVKKVLMQSNNDPEKAARILKDMPIVLARDKIGATFVGSSQPSSSTSSFNLTQDPILPPPAKKARGSSTSTSSKSDASPEKKKKEDGKKEQETVKDCIICTEGFPDTSNEWRHFKCNKHRVCYICFDRLATTTKSRSGQDCITRTCPECMMIMGQQTGTSPKGTSDFELCSDMSCKGYPNTDTIQIHYRIGYGRNLIHRTALLPFVPEGIEAFKILRIAWDRFLCFEYVKKPNMKESVLAYSSKLPQKTAYGGGPDKFGYPDAKYFQALNEAAEKLGIIP